MFPARFDYVAPRSLDEAMTLLHQHGDDAKVLAGGQSLIPLLKLRLATPSLLVDIGRVPAMAGISADERMLRIGARTRHSDIEADASLATRSPLVADAVRLISDPLVRNMGTAGGSVCHADPAGDWGSVMLALSAEFVVRSHSGERTIPAADFFQGPFTTALRADEIMTEIRIPLAQGRASGTYLKLERKVGDFATVGVAVQVEMDDGRVGRAGIALTAVGPTNLRAVEAEQSLAGQVLSDSAIANAARLAAQAAEPRSDIRGNADYKKDVVRIFVQRGLRTARQRVEVQ